MREDVHCAPDERSMHRSPNGLEMSKYPWQNEDVRGDPEEALRCGLGIYQTLHGYLGGEWWGMESLALGDQQ
jgi:hypothetical protein